MENRKAKGTVWNCCSTAPTAFSTVWGPQNATRQGDAGRADCRWSAGGSSDTAMPLGSCWTNQPRLSTSPGPKCFFPVLFSADGERSVWAPELNVKCPDSTTNIPTMGSSARNSAWPRSRATCWKNDANSSTAAAGKDWNTTLCSRARRTTEVSSSSSGRPGAMGPAASPFPFRTECLADTVRARLGVRTAWETLLHSDTEVSPVPLLRNRRLGSCVPGSVSSAPV
mmetsp:Transcript_7983/g.17401  ORF Transcript_7983/g.17401 Transcript_7983/m.17401 type:complete len:226 (-) Transcript_7983:152-829(-)